MWRISFAFIIFLLASACGTAEATPSDALEQPLQIEAVDLAIADLADQFNVDSETIQVIQVEDDEWQDSCLGLGGAAESCLLVITPGFRITLEADGTQYIYRTDQLGIEVRLEQVSE
jgi:hypothetical protein